MVGSVDPPPPVRLVLVHGSCHGAWCWEEVVGPLQERGWVVSAPDLPFTSFFDDAEAVRREIAAAKHRGERVVVVGHSYGGAVITQGGEAADHLVICAGPLPDIGEIVDDPRAATPEVTPADVFLPDGMFTLDPVRAAAGFFHRSSPEQACRAGERMRPMPAASFDERLTKAAWRHVPTSYIVCGDDRAFGASFQRSLLDRVRDHTEFDCDHSLFYSAAGPLIDRLHDIATEVGQRRTSKIADPELPAPVRTKGERMDAQEQSDRLELMHLEASYTVRFDTKDVEAWADLFTEDGSYTPAYFARTPHDVPVAGQGREALIAFAKAFPERTQHIFGIPYFTIEGDRAAARIPMVSIGVGEYGTHQASQLYHGYYDVQYKRTPAGWRIHRRQSNVITQSDSYQGSGPAPVDPVSHD